MTTRLVSGKIKLSGISEGRVQQLSLALRQDAGEILDEAVAEFYAKNRKVVDDYHKRLNVGLVFDVPAKIEELKESPEIALPEMPPEADEVR